MFLNLTDLFDLTSPLISHEYARSASVSVATVAYDIRKTILSEQRARKMFGKILFFFSLPSSIIWQETRELVGRL